MNFEGGKNGVNSKVTGSRAISRGTGIGGRGSSKILQRSNIISNNNGTPNLNGNKGKAIGVTGQAQISDDDKYPYGNARDTGANGGLGDKDLDIFGKGSIASQGIGSGKYTKSKSIVGGKLPEKSINGPSFKSDNMDQNEEMQQLREELQQMKMMMLEKDQRLKQQEQELKFMNAQKTRDAKKIRELEAEVRKLKADELKMGKHKSERPQLRRGFSNDSDKEEDEDEEEEEVQRQPMTRQQMVERERERDMLLQMMMGNMFEMRPQVIHAQRAEEEMLQKALEESRRMAAPEQLNPDDLTYEQMLALEERNGGKVACGLSAAEIRKIPQITWRFKNDTSKQTESCSICMDVFKYGDKVKELNKCKHAFHTRCIDKWLENENKCPICKQEI